MLYFLTLSHIVTLLFMIAIFPLEPAKYQWNYLALPKFNVYFHSAQLLTSRYPNLDVYKIKSNPVQYNNQLGKQLYTSYLELP